MPKTELTSIRELTLDLRNFRTVPQESEVYAIQAMIAASQKHFWALTESIIDSGYLPTENILVLRRRVPSEELVVKDGNRRVAALKLIFGYLGIDATYMRQPTRARIEGITDEWRSQNQKVPCTIYDEEEAQVVDKIVALAHGKGEEAGKHNWNAIARARHERTINNANVPYLDLLEKYLEEGRNITPAERDEWATDYPVSVLEDAIKRVAPQVGTKNSSDLAQQYPNIEFRDQIELIIHDIGTKNLRFKRVRSTSFPANYGLPPNPSNNATVNLEEHSIQADNEHENESRQPGSSEEFTELLAPKLPSKTDPHLGKPAAAPIEDQRSVKRQLRQLRPIGENRRKVVTLQKEALQLDLTKTPLAFCFVIRSMFEISAKAYCEDYATSGGPASKNTDGTDRSLGKILEDIKNHIVRGMDQKPDTAKQRMLHGAIVELNKSEGILSVTSMNQLIHNPAFSVAVNDICRVFGNIFPLLEAMNQ